MWNLSIKVSGAGVHPGVEVWTNLIVQPDYGMPSQRLELLPASPG